MKKGTKPKPASTGEKHESRKPNGTFAPGVSGNPAGRPAGSRNKLTEDLIQALCDDFATHGVAAIKTVREKDPGAYLRTIAALVPKQTDLAVTSSPLSDLSDDEIDRMIRRLASEHGIHLFEPEGTA